MTPPQCCPATFNCRCGLPSSPLTLTSLLPRLLSSLKKPSTIVKMRFTSRSPLVALAFAAASAQLTSELVSLSSSCQQAVTGLVLSDFGTCVNIVRPVCFEKGNQCVPTSSTSPPPTRARTALLPAKKLSLALFESSPLAKALSLLVSGYAVEYVAPSRYDADPPLQSTTGLAGLARRHAARRPSGPLPPACRLAVSPTSPARSILP